MTITISALLRMFASPTAVIYFFSYYTCHTFGISYLTSLLRVPFNVIISHLAPASVLIGFVIIRVAPTTGTNSALLLQPVCNSYYPRRSYDRYKFRVAPATGL